MFEKRHQKLAAQHVFFQRQLRFALAGLVLVAIALGIGVFGYHTIAGMPWVDALLNASMILGGMGPVDTLQGDAAKIFASSYALFSGLVSVSMGVMLAPTLHRLMHYFHIEDRGNDGDDD